MLTTAAAVLFALSMLLFAYAAKERKREQATVIDLRDSAVAPAAVADTRTRQTV